MKHAKEAFVFLFLLATPVLLAGVLSPAINNEVKTTISPITTKVNVPSYEERAPILAYNDLDMDNYASALSWDGNGSPDTPYIIDGYNITSDGTCIEIRNTVRAFEIRNCYVSSISSIPGTGGIYISNVTQAAIVDTFVLNKYWCIDIMNTPAPYIENCTIHDCYTINLSNCTGATITECDIYDNANDGINLYKCNNSLISNNEIFDNGGTGLYLESSDFLTITTNTIAKNSNEGIELDTCNNATIRDNDIWENNFPGSQAGLYIYYGHYNLIEANRIWNNSDTGIYSDYADNIQIKDNQIYNHSNLGIYTYDSPHSRMTGNDIWCNGHDLDPYGGGIYVDSSNDSLIENNQIWNNTYTGIYIDDSEHVEISSNHIFNNTADGIYAESGAQVAILENQIHGNGWNVANDWEGHGISFSGSVVDSRIEGNEIFNNTHYGVYAYGSRNDILGNEIYDHPDWGIAIIMCFNDTVAENVVYNNGGAGIEVYSIGSNVTENIVFDNELGIHLYGAQSCRLWGNDIGWNDNNALEESSMPNNMWYNNVTNVGNWWGNYDGVGVYDISNGTSIVNHDMFPSKSLDLVKPASIEFEILETGNVIVWEVSALNPSHFEIFIDGSSVGTESWDGGDIEFVADGLAHGVHTIELVIYHISGHSIGNSTTADVEDLTPPDIDGPSHVVITVGEAVSEQYIAEDPSGIGSWAVNDTVNFAVDSSGLLTSVTDLPVGEYTVRITVSDTYGHSTYHDVTITVNAVPGLPPTAMLMIVAGGGIVVLVVLIIGYKTKRG